MDWVVDSRDVERLTYGNMEWPLHRPVWNPVRTTFLNNSYHCEDFWETRDFELLNIQPNEALFLMHEAPRTTEIEYDRSEDQKSPIKYAKDNLRFDFCPCSTGLQLIYIPALVHAGWKNKDSDPYGAMLKAVSDTDFPRLLSASLSAYAPEEAYFQMCDDLENINKELEKLHEIMLKREEERKQPNFSCYTFSTAAEASLFSVLEEHYCYTEHGSSLGGCWLEDFYRDKEKAPKFVIN